MKRGWMAVGALLVSVLAGTAIALTERGGDALSPITECRTRTHAWAEQHPGIYKTAGSPLFSCVDVPFNVWHAHWLSSINTIEINVGSFSDDPTLAHLSVDRFYTGLLWHEIGHAYGDATGSYYLHQSDYAALRPESLTGKAPVEDYAFTFAYSFGRYDSWHVCADCAAGIAATGWTPPTPSELAHLRAAGFLPG